MAVLEVENGYRATIPGLGKIRSFRRLSEKRITKTVREALRMQYGDANIEVCCAACFEDDHWEGSCKILGTQHPYSVRRAEFASEG